MFSQPIRFKGLRDSNFKTFSSQALSSQKVIRKFSYLLRAESKPTDRSMWDAGNWDQQWSKGISQNACKDVSRQWLHAALKSRMHAKVHLGTMAVCSSRAECMQRCISGQWLYAALKSRMHAKVRLETMAVCSSQEQTVFARTERWRNSEMTSSSPLHQKRNQ